MALAMQFDGLLPEVLVTTRIELLWLAKVTDCAAAEPVVPGSRHPGGDNTLAANNSRL